MAFRHYIQQKTASNVYYGSNVNKLKVSNFSYVAFSTSTTPTITIPSSSQSGDLAVLFDSAYSTTSTIPSSVIPTNWTLVQENSESTGLFGEALKSTISYKVLNSSDPNTNITGMNSDFDGKTILVFRPNFPINIISEVSNGSATDTSTNPTQQTISVTSQLHPIIAFSYYDTNSTIATRGSSVTMTELAGVFDSYVKYIIYNNAEDIQNIDITMSGSGTLRIMQSGYFTFT